LFQGFEYRITPDFTIQHGGINVTTNANFVNITNLVQGSIYEVLIAAYTAGFMVGPPSFLGFNTSFSM